MPGEKPPHTTQLIHNVFKMLTFAETEDEHSLHQLLQKFSCTSEKLCKTNIKAAALSADKKLPDTPRNGGCRTGHLSCFAKAGDEAFRYNLELTQPKEGQIHEIEPTGTNQQMVYLVVLTQANESKLRECCKEVMKRVIQQEYDSIGFDILSTDKPFNADLQDTIQVMAEEIIDTLLEVPQEVRPKVVLYKNKMDHRRLIKTTFRKVAQQKLLVHNFRQERLQALHKPKHKKQFAYLLCNATPSI